MTFYSYRAYSKFSFFQLDMAKKVYTRNQLHKKMILEEKYYMHYHGKQITCKKKKGGAITNKKVSVLILYLSLEMTNIGSYPL